MEMHQEYCIAASVSSFSRERRNNFFKNCQLKTKRQEKRKNQFNFGELLDRAIQKSEVS